MEISKEGGHQARTQNIRAISFFAVSLGIPGGEAVDSSGCVFSKCSISAAADSIVFIQCSFSKKQDSKFLKWQKTLLRSSDLILWSFIRFNIRCATFCEGEGWDLVPCSWSTLVDLDSFISISESTDIERYASLPSAFRLSAQWSSRRSRRLRMSERISLSLTPLLWLSSS